MHTTHTSAHAFDTRTHMQTLNVRVQTLLHTERTHSNADFSYNFTEEPQGKDSNY